MPIRLVITAVLICFVCIYYSPQPTSTADGQSEEEKAASVGEVVSQVTVKALQEVRIAIKVKRVWCIFF